MGNRLSIILGIVLPVALFAQTQPPSVPKPIPQFEDITQRAGTTVPHNSTPEKRYIIESMSGGVGFIDCDNDSKLDIIMVNGSSVDRFKQGGDHMITLYRHDSNLHLADITKSALLTRNGRGMVVFVMDYYNDGL